MKPKFTIQDSQYEFPYHHLTSFEPFDNRRVMISGIEYYGYMSKVLELINKLQYKSLLDVGCGDGKMIFELAKTHKDKVFVGVDLSEHSIAFAKAFNFKNNSRFLAEDVSKAEGEFDIITLIETLEHVPNEEITPLMSNVKSKLKNNGKLIISVPSVNFPLKKKHYRHYDLEILKKQLQGFDIEECFYVSRDGFLHLAIIKFTYKFSSFHLIRRILVWVYRKFIMNADVNNGRHIVCICRKMI